MSFSTSAPVSGRSKLRRALRASMVSLIAAGALASGAAGAHAAPSALPVGGFTRMTGSDGQWILSLWADDADADAAPALSVAVDGVDVNASVQASSGNSLTMSIAMPSTAGKHYVCVWAVDDGEAHTAVLIGCRTGTVKAVAAATPTTGTGTTTATTAPATPAPKNHIPVGKTTRLVGDRAAGTWTISGYVRDYDTLDQGVQLSVAIDGVDVAAGEATAPSHLFAISMPRPAAGKHTVCVWAIDTTSGVAAVVGCRTGRV